MNNTEGMPLYYKVAEDIKDKIITGEYKPGDKMPSEIWLMERYGVSRVTIRKALDALIDEKYLISKKKMGKYVASVYFDFDHNALPCVHKYLERQGIKPTSRILSMSIMEAPEDLSIQFKCPIGEPLMLIERVRYADDVPFAHEYMYLRTKFFNKDFNPWELTSRCFHDVLQQDYGIVLDCVKESVRNVQVEERQMNLLRIDNKDKVLTKVEILMMLRNDIIEYEVSYQNTDIVPLIFTWQSYR